MNKDVSLTSLTKRIFKSYVVPQRKRLFVAIIAMLVTSISTSGIPYFLKPLVNKLLEVDGVKGLYLYAPLIMIVFVVKGLSGYVQSVKMTQIGEKIVAEVQKDLFTSYMRLDLGFFHKNNSGELLSRFSSDVGLMRYAFSNTFVGITKDFFTVLFLLALVFYHDAKLSFVTILLFPLSTVVLLRIGRKMRKVTNNTQVIRGQLIGRLNQVLHNIRVVKAYRTEDVEKNLLSKRVDEIFALAAKAARTKSIQHPVMEILGGMAVVGIIAYGGIQVAEGTRTAGDFLAFIVALLLAYEPMKRLAKLNANLQEGLAAAKRVFDVIDEKSYILNSSTAGNVPAKLQGEIHIENLQFRYENQSLNTLDGIDIQVPKGKAIALVGPSGAGKSTIINLMPRFYDATAGAINIDQMNIKDLPLAFLRQNIALVSQEIALFDMSVAENITYGLGVKTQAEIEEAAKCAAAHDFIQALPQGYETLIGENGVRVSGGQRQRIAIARAVLKNAPILLLDEATSALDTESERVVQKALEQLMKNRTTIIVAHRLSTIINSDMIYVLDKGKIAESGSHKQLVKQGGLYATLWRQQSEDSLQA